MKKFSVRKISALALVLCLFVSVFANAGISTVRAEDVANGSDVAASSSDVTTSESDATTATVSVNLVGDGTLYGFAATGYNDVNGNWVTNADSWITSSDDVLTFDCDGSTAWLSWDTSVVNDIYLNITGKSAATNWIQLYLGGFTGSASITVYQSEDGKSYTTEAPAPDDETEDTDGTTATATVTYAGASTSYWFGSTSCANADKTAWPSYDWISEGSNDYITITANGASWTVTWDTTKVAEVYVEFGANINDAAQKVWPTLTDGAAFTYYDAEDGTLTTEEPAVALPNSSTITYAGEQSVVFRTWGYWDNTLGTWVGLDAVIGDGQSYTDEAGKLTLSRTGNTLTVSWADDIGPNAGVEVNGATSDEYRYFPSHSNGAASTVYDAADGTLTLEAPASANFTATATVTYMGSQSVWTGSDGAWVIADQEWVNSWLAGPGSNDYAAISHVGNTYTIKWDPEVANPNFRMGVWGDFEDEFAPELYDGAAYTLYDGDGELVTELPAKYASAKIVYMGAHTDTWTTSYGLTPTRTDINGWWINDNASPDAPVGAYTMCIAEGNTYTYVWDANVGNTCWVLFGCNSYEGDAPYFGLKDGGAVYLYDQDILGRLSTSAPLYYTCSVEVNGAETSWAGISALCNAYGEWTSGLWIADANNDYGITTTTTTTDGKTVYTFTYDKNQISTVCVETGTVDFEGNNSRIWTNFSNNSTRRFYIAEENGGLTTFPPGYTYVKSGAGEGLDATLRVHYIRDDANYSGWYFGYWYQVAGEWFSYNKTFNSEGIYDVDLIDIAANEIGFVVNYNDWASKDIEEDRFIQIDKLIADENGLYHVYLYSGDATVYYEPKA